MTCAANTPERDATVVIPWCEPDCHIFAFGSLVCRCGARIVAPFAPTTDAPTEIDLATAEIARLNRTLGEVRRLAALSSSDLLIEWRRRCINQNRFTAPDWETGEAGMLRVLLRAATGEAS